MVLLYNYLHPNWSEDIDWYAARSCPWCLLWSRSGMSWEVSLFAFQHINIVSSCFKVLVFHWDIEEAPNPLFLWVYDALQTTCAVSSPSSVSPVSTRLLTRLKAELLMCVFKGDRGPSGVCPQFLEPVSNTRAVTLFFPVSHCSPPPPERL